MRHLHAISRRDSGTASIRFTIAAFLLAVLALTAVALWMRPSPIGVLRPANLAIALRGAMPEAELTSALADAAEHARREKRSEWMWRDCVDAVGVLSLPVPPGADDDWRRTVVDQWAAESRWDHAIYKEGGDAIYPPSSQSFQFKVLPLAERRDDMEPFERELMNAHPDKLFVIAMEYDCPDPNPAWKDSVRSLLAFLGAR